MKDLTKRYLEEYSRARKKSYLRKKEVEERIRTYRGRNHLLTSSSFGFFSLMYGVAMNYLEVRPCLYRYSSLCMECKKEIYIVGINCKACGSWVCTVCIVLVDGVSLCRDCLGALLFEDSTQKRECSPERIEQYKLLKKCIQSPCSISIGILANELKRMENPSKELEEFPEEEIIRKNLIARTKKVLCDWYVFKAQEERCSILINQLEYLHILKEENPHQRSPIERAIEEILLEITQCNNGSN
ncbi:hypothetical protein NEFER03_0511 [Nematocida sp. LUAm3]|nr:hypothetical protein NEFER03_0511 [Nematocida sp. LUAm3]KAI5175478.1 hypothetical protein NEFER02_1384 [Nematocida sp. LUAm2]KAI5178492.1 hypothetical protein NEFER01_1639 [Nematocida sp. LUAm1]